MTMTQPGLRPGAARQVGERWRLSRAGIVNVWHYLDNEFDLSGGRMILRGTTGSGKSRALEMLLPFLLDADRRRMDSTGMGKVNLDELMRVGADGQTNRTGYLWLELARAGGEHLTLGALIRHSKSAGRTQVWYFTTSLRVGRDLTLLSADREVLTREALTAAIGSERITDSGDAHRERVRGAVFGLHGDAGRERFRGLLQLLHTLRAPDVGNRIDEGRLPQILADSMPPLGEQALAAAGEQLDGLTETRAAQQRLESAHAQVEHFLRVYRRYAAATLLDTAARTLGAADAVTAAEREAAARSAAHRAVEQQFSDVRAEHGRLEAELAELDNAVRGIQGRAIFKQADDLVQRDRAVGALAQAADQAMRAADRERTNHARAVADADRRREEMTETAAAGAGLAAEVRALLHELELPDGAVPDQIRVVALPAETGTSILRRTREADPTPVARPAPGGVRLVPADIAEARAGSLTAATAVAERQELAGRRAVDARRLAADERQVQSLEADAARALDTADTDARDASAAADARDDAAVALAVGWREWVALPATTEVLGDVAWADTAVAPLLTDVETLAGTEAPERPAAGDTRAAGDVRASGADVLARLDEAARQAGRPVLARVAAERSQLRAAAEADAGQRAALQAEQSELEALRDTPPVDAPWLVSERPGTPLWQAVDFGDEVPPSDRAGIEGALLAAGLLTARIEADGTVRSDDGEVLLSPAGAVAVEPLSAVLRPEPASPVPTDVVAAVLGSIGYAGDGSPPPDARSSVGPDGSWHHGALRGRHQPPIARHIGAAARAAARRERLAAIAAELHALDVAAAARTAQLSNLLTAERRIDAHVGSAPRATELRLQRGLALAGATRASRSRTAAERAAGVARERRSRWSAELATHRDTCRHHGLPTGVRELEALVAAAERAGSACRRLAAELGRLDDAARRHAVSIERVTEAETTRDDAELEADHRWGQWSDLAAEVAALHEAIDLEVDQVRGELERTERALVQTRAARSDAQHRLDGLGPQEGTARAQRDAAVAAIGIALESMVDVAGWFSRRVRLRGLVSAATAERIEPIARPESTDEVRAAAQGLRGVLTEPRPTAGENAVLTALQTFDREVSGQLDVRPTVDEGVHLVEVAGAGDDRTPAGAAAALAARVEAGRSALSEREREVFTTFVLGGLAEELRRRVNQAAQLVKAMNSSLASIRTSNGIGVHLSWKLAEDDPALARILTLVATSDAVRSQAQSDELTGLLRRRVEEFRAADPTSGYANHLGVALDYRRWHDVVVTILGPEPEQRRHLSGRAKLSQGETRFVSYVTLFAAADGYLTSLGEDATALRLVLLDDAFAKVDDGTVGELMGLLVDLDIDFVMTGHGLWGCFAQVPSLDVYEVRRAKGTCAVTTHIHWDGHHRHLRSTP